MRLNTTICARHRTHAHTLQSQASHTVAFMRTAIDAGATVADETALAAVPGQFKYAYVEPQTQHVVSPSVSSGVFGTSAPLEHETRRMHANITCRQSSRQTRTQHTRAQTDRHR